MKLQDFKEMIRRTLFCASGGNTVSFRGVLLEKKKGELVMVATNNRLVGFASKTVGDGFPDFDGVLVPPEALEKIAERKQDTAVFAISFSGETINFHIASACISVEAQQGAFPRLPRNGKDFLEDIFPPFWAAVNRQSLLEALGMVSVILEHSNRLHLAFSEGTVTLRTFEEEDSAATEVPCDYAGESVEIAVNMQYFTQMLEHIDEKCVDLRFDSGKTLAVLPLQREDYHFFLAQMKLD